MHETLYYAAMLRLPRHLSRADKLARVAAVTAALGLLGCQDTIVGARAPLAGCAALLPRTSSQGAAPCRPEACSVWVPAHTHTLHPLAPYPVHRRLLPQRHLWGRAQAGLHRRGAADQPLSPHAGASRGAGAALRCSCASAHAPGRMVRHPWLHAPSPTWQCRAPPALPPRPAPCPVHQDEPTSGLDSTTSHHVLAMLRQLARGGRAIITTIHQPSSRLYAQLDKLLLLSQARGRLRGNGRGSSCWPSAAAPRAQQDLVPLAPIPLPPAAPSSLPQGDVMYFGGAAAAADWFGGLGYPLPFATSLADFILDLASGDMGDPER